MYMVASIILLLTSCRFGNISRRRALPRDGAGDEDPTVALWPAVGPPAELQGGTQSTKHTWAN